MLSFRYREIVLHSQFPLDSVYVANTIKEKIHARTRTNSKNGKHYQ